jgi:hypothetical protein
MVPSPFNVDCVSGTACLTPAFIACSKGEILFPVSNIDPVEFAEIKVSVTLDPEAYILLNDPGNPNTWNGWTIDAASGDRLTYTRTVIIPPNFGSALDPIGNPIGVLGIIPPFPLELNPMNGPNNGIVVDYITGGDPIEFFGAVDNDRTNLFIADGTRSSQITETISPAYHHFIRLQGNNTIVTNVPSAPILISVFRVQGKFIIDEDISFIPQRDAGVNIATAKVFVLEPGAEIIVENGKTLTINGAMIGGCQQLAQGITVRPNGRLNFVGNTISDCRWAVSTSTASRLNCAGNTFIDNYIGYNANGVALLTAPFAGNTFSSSALKPKFAAMLENFGSIGFAGISITNFRDFNSWGGNTFNSLANGIVALRSNMNLDRLVMTNIGDGTFNGHPVNGFGVHFTGNTIGSNFLNLGKAGFGSNITARAAGVYCKRAAGTIENSTFSAMQPIIWEESQLRDKVILRNNVTAGLRAAGITLANCEPTPHDDYRFGLVQSNIISAPKGIVSTDVHSTTAARGWKFEKNTISVVPGVLPIGDFPVGIQYNSGVNGWIYNNPITSTFSGALGIRMRNTQGTYANDNILTGAAGVNSVGVLLEGNMSAQLECNKFTGYGSGIRVLGNNGGSQLKGSNDLNMHAIGIEYGSPASGLATGATGEQLHNGNIFVNSTLGTGGIHRDNVAYVSDRFYVDQDEARDRVDPTGARTFMPLLRTPFDWFRDQSTSGLSFSCISPNPAPCEYSWNSTIANNEWQPTLYPEEQKWNAAYLTYYDLIDERSTLANQPCEPIFTRFMRENENSIRALIAEIKDLRNQLYALTAAQKLDLQSKTDAMYAASNNLAELERELQVGSIDLDVQISAVTTVYERSIVDLEAFNAQLKADRTRLATRIMTMNAAINPTSEIENNYVQVNDIAMRLLIEERDAVGEEISQLTQIAQQCPFKGGNAVYEARAMLKGTVQVDDEVACSPEATSERAAQVIALISPNPAKTEIRVLNHVGKNYQISDAFGRIVAQGVLDSEMIQLTSHPSGVYAITLWDAKTRAITHKFTIVQD